MRRISKSAVTSPHFTQTLLPWAVRAAATTTTTTPAASKHAKRSAKRERADKRTEPTSPSPPSPSSSPPSSSCSTRDVVADFKKLAPVCPYYARQAFAVMKAYRFAHAEDAYSSASADGAPALPPLTAESTPCLFFFTGQLTTERGERIHDMLALGGRADTSEGAPKGPGRKTTARDWDPDKLEYRHDYVQWLFPLRVAGMNWAAPTLTGADAHAIRCSAPAMTNVLKGVQLMMRFYGISLTLKESASIHSNNRMNEHGIINNSLPSVDATLTRTKRRAEWLAQTRNLATSSHNYLRVSRLLQFLGEMHLEPLKVALLQYLAHEIFVSDREGLGEACAESFCTFWIETPYAAEDRRRLKSSVLDMLSSDDEGSALPPPYVTAELCVPVGTEVP